MIRKIQAFLVKEVSLTENAEEKSAEFVNRVCQVTLDAFWTQNVKGEEGFDRTDSIRPVRLLTGSTLIARPSEDQEDPGLLSERGKPDRTC